MGFFGSKVQSAVEFRASNQMIRGTRSQQTRAQLQIGQFHFAPS